MKINMGNKKKFNFELYNKKERKFNPNLNYAFKQFFITKDNTL